MLDLVRYLSAISDTFINSCGEKIVETALKACEWDATWTPSKAREITTLLAIRTIANLTATRSGQHVLAGPKIPEVCALQSDWFDLWLTSTVFSFSLILQVNIPMKSSTKIPEWLWPPLHSSRLSHWRRKPKAHAD